MNNKLVGGAALLALVLIGFIGYRNWPLDGSSQTAAAGASRSEPVRIGFIAPLTGPFADWAESIRNGVEIARLDTKHTFEIDYQDDACEPKQAVSIAQKFFGTDDIRFVIGPGCDGSLQAIASLARQSGAILFSTGLLGDDIFKENPTNVINLTTQISTEADFMAAYLATQGITRVAIVHGNNLFGVEYGKRLPEALVARGMSVVANEQTSLDATDFRTTVAKVLKEKPDAIFVHQGEAQIGIFAKQLRESGSDVPLFAYYGVESDSLLAAGGAALEGLTYTYPVNSADGQSAKADFERRYAEAFSGKTPTATSYFAYDGMMLLDKAFDVCSATDGACVEKFFKEYGAHEGISGRMEIQPDGKNVRPFGTKKIENGEFRWVTKEVKL